jgi:hypothetical protein
MAGIKEARQALLEERNRIAAAIKEQQQKLSEVDAALRSLDSLMGNGRVARGRRPATTRAAQPAGRTARKGRPPREGTMAAAIEAFLADQGRKAAHANAVLEHLQGVGKAPSGKNPKASVEQTLRQLEQRGRVKNAGRNTWRKLAA